MRPLQWSVLEVEIFSFLSGPIFPLLPYQMLYYPTKYLDQIRVSLGEGVKIAYASTVTLQPALELTF